MEDDDDHGLRHRLGERIEQAERLRRVALGDGVGERPRAARYGLGHE